MSVEVKGSDGSVVTLSQRLIKGSDLETNPTLLTLDDIPMPQGVTNNSNVAYSDFSAFVTDIPNNNDFRGPDGPQGPAIDSVSLTQSVDLSTVQMSFTYVKDGQSYTINSNPSFTLPTGPTGQQGNSLQSLTHDSQNNTLTFSFTDSVAIPDLTVNLPQGDEGPQGRGISTITKNGDVMTVGYSDGSVSTFSGITGPAGTASTVTVDSTNTLSAGSSASVTETPTSTSQNRELIFNIPTGAQGPQGNDGKEISTIALADNPSDSTQYQLTVTYDDSTTNSVVFDKPADGVDGNTGATGLGYTGGYYNSSTGTVTFTSNDGLGFVTQDLRGTDGKEISTAVLGTDPDNSANYRLTFTYNDSTTSHVNFAKPIDGVDGVDGQDGVIGADGKSITAVNLGTDPNNSANYRISFTYNDNTSDVVTFAKPADGVDGVDGVDGTNGTNGTTTTNVTIGTDPNNSANYIVTFTYNDSSTNSITFAKPADGVDGVDGFDNFAPLSKADGNIIIGDGTNFITESGATARASLGVPEVLTDLGISDGTVGQVLTTDGNGAFSFANPTGGAGGGGGVSAEYTATGAITAGNFVALRQDGTVETVSGTTSTAPTVTLNGYSTAPVNPTSGGGPLHNNGPIIYDQANDVFLKFATWELSSTADWVVCWVGTLSNNVISWGTFKIVVGNTTYNKHIERLAIDIDPTTGIFVIACHAYSSTYSNHVLVTECSYDSSTGNIISHNQNNLVTTNNRNVLTVTYCPWAYSEGGSASFNGRFLITCMGMNKPYDTKFFLGYYYKNSSNTGVLTTNNSTSYYVDAGLVDATANWMLSNSYGVETIPDPANERVYLRATAYFTNPSSAARMRIAYIDVSSTSAPTFNITAFTDGTTSAFFPYYVGSNTYHNRWNLASIAWDNTNEILYIVTTDDTDGNNLKLFSYSVSGGTVTQQDSVTLYTRPSSFAASADPAAMCKILFDDSLGTRILYVLHEEPDPNSSTAYSNFVRLKVFTPATNGTIGSATNSIDVSPTANTSLVAHKLDNVSFVKYSTGYFAYENPEPAQTVGSAFNFTSNVNEWIGIATEDIANAATGNILLSGSVDSSQTGLVDGTEYYLNYTGTLQSSSSSLTTSEIVGKAIGTTNFHIIGKSYERFGGSRDVDFSTNSPLTTSGLILTSDGSGGFNFQTNPTDLADLADVDSTTNTPLSTSGLVLTSDGSGGFNFQSAGGGGGSPTFSGFTGGILNYGQIGTSSPPWNYDTLISSDLSALSTNNNIEISISGYYYIFFAGEMYKASSASSYYGYTSVMKWDASSSTYSYYYGPYTGQSLPVTGRLGYAQSEILYLDTNDRITFRVTANSSSYIKWILHAGLYLIGT